MTVRSKKTMKVGTVVVGTSVYVVTEAIFAGSRNRYNVHRIQLNDLENTQVIAREVTKSVAEKVIKRVANEGLS